MFYSISISRRISTCFPCAVSEQQKTTVEDRQKKPPDTIMLLFPEIHTLCSVFPLLFPPSPLKDTKAKL